MVSKIGLMIEVNGKMVRADMRSLAWMSAEVVGRILETVGIVVWDAERKLLVEVKSVSVNGDCVQLNIQ